MSTKRSDGNHWAIVEGLRQSNHFVVSTHNVGGGFPDIVVSRNGVWCLIEIKDPVQAPSARKLTPAQRRFHDEARAPVYVVTSLQEAIDAVSLEVARRR